MSSYSYHLGFYASGGPPRSNLVQTPTLTVGAVNTKAVPATTLTQTATLLVADPPTKATLILTPTISVVGLRTAVSAKTFTSIPTLVVSALKTKHASRAFVVTVTMASSGFETRFTPLRTIYPRPPESHPFRIIVQRILDKKIIEWDLNVNSDFQYVRQLSGPTIMSGSFREALSIQELGLDGYSHWFHVEVDNEIRASAIMLPPQYQENGLTFTCEGLTAIPHYYTYGAVHKGIGLDPLNIVRNIWNHVQAQPNSQYGIAVSNTTSNVKLGKAAYTTTTPAVPPETEPTITDFEAEPYELVWWESTNCGEEIDSLAQQTPFDYVEKSTYNLNKTAIAFSVSLGFPRSGTARPQLLFNEENIKEVVPVQEAEDAYASKVVIIGIGEGRSTIYGSAALAFGNRVPKTVAITDKNVKTTEHANAMAVAELGRRQGKLFEISEIVIQGNHENAPQGSYDLGDDIKVSVDIPWLLDTYTAWYRIISISVQPSSDLIRLGLARADSFTYPVV